MDDLEKKVNAVNDEIAKLMNSGDSDKIWDYYSDDVISLPSYEPMIKGIEAARESAEKMEESGVKIVKFASNSTDIMKSGNMVVDIGTYKISMQIPEMDAPWDDHGKYLHIWEILDDGSMKLKVETWNTDVNPWMEMQQMKEHHERGQHMKTEDIIDEK
jgi:ketosteroid isomerase-like protein